MTTNERTMRTMDIATVIKDDPSVRTLTPHDRCDRCGAQALVQVELKKGDLLWCGHHAKKYDTGTILVDDRPALDAEENGR
jgi:hypothetical protein